jgi:hypothetical protein
MFSRLIVTNITCTRGTLHCRKTRIPCGDQFVIYGKYTDHSMRLGVVVKGKFSRFHKLTLTFQPIIMTFFKVVFCHF